MATAQPVGERPAWVDDELFPFESRFVALDGNVVHYVDEGSGPILLMLHSNPVWSFVYREVIVALRDRFRCIALDFPGFGLSSGAPGYQVTVTDSVQGTTQTYTASAVGDFTSQSGDGLIPISAATTDTGGGATSSVVSAGASATSLRNFRPEAFSSNG